MHSIQYWPHSSLQKSLEVNCIGSKVTNHSGLSCSGDNKGCTLACIQHIMGQNHYPENLGVPALLLPTPINQFSSQSDSVTTDPIDLDLAGKPFGPNEGLITLYIIWHWRRKMAWARGATTMTHTNTSSLSFISLQI